MIKGKKLLICCFAQCMLYFVQFFIVPVLPISTEKSVPGILTLSISTVIISSFIMYQYVNEFRYWFIGIFLYHTLIYIHCPLGLYGINKPRQLIDLTISSHSGTDTILVPMTVLIVQFFIWFIIKFIEMVQKGY